MKALTIILLFTSLSTAFAQQTQQVPKPLTEQERWNKLMNLIKTEEKTIEMARNKTDHLLYRLLELKTEKLRLYKEKENKKFIALKMKHGSKVKREAVFTNTLNLYEKVQALGRDIIRRYPKTRYKAEIYYTMGLNSRDFAYDNQEKKYLELALTNAPKYSQIEFFAKTSLAEYFYNNKKYPQAVNLYESVIKNTQDEWYTKNLYNFAWCLVKVKKFDKGINLLEKSYHLSKSPHYMNFSEQALHSLITFYVIGEQIDKGEKFIRDNETDPFPHLFKLMKKVADRGYYEKAAGLIDKLVLMIPKAQLQDVIDLKVYQIMFYKKYKEDHKLIEVAKSLVPLPLQPETKTEILEHMQQRVGLHQMTIKKNFTKSDYTYNVNDLALIEDYFDTLALLDTDNKATYQYYLAETYYAVLSFEKALSTYSQAFENYLPGKTAKDFRQKSLTAMMGAVEAANLKKDQEQKQIEYIYSNYLKNWPKDKLSQKIFPKFFYLKMERKQLDQAHDTIVSFANSFPEDLKLQKELFKQVMDYHIEHKNTLPLAENIKLMASGFLKFEKSEVKKAEMILANILFTNFQNMAQKGDREQAIAGFLSVYNNKNYPKIILADAAFNAGIVYTDMLDSGNAIKWYQKAFELYNKKQKQKKKDALVRLSTRMYLLQDFINSAKLSNFILTDFCSEKSKQNTEIFYQSIRAELANDYVSKALHTFESLSHCTNGELTPLEKDMIQHFYVFNHNKTLRDFLLNKGIKQKHNDLAVHYLKKHFWINYLAEDRKAHFILKDLAKFNCEDCQSLGGQVKQLEKYQKKIKRYFYSAVSVGEQFQPEKFNKDLEARLIQAKALIDEGNKLLEYKNANITLLTLQELYRLSTKLEKELADLDIPKEDPEFRKQFKLQMNSLAQNFNVQSQKFIKLTYKVVEDSDIYHSYDIPSLNGIHILEMADIRTPASEVVATIDILKRK